MKFERRVLKNGIVLLHERREVPVVSLSITNRFGAAYETSDIKGIAHVMEHLVFTGTKTRTHEEISREVEKRGGILNAFTSQDVTSFWFKMPAEHLFVGLNILTDIMNNAAFPEAKFEKEKKVIVEEIKMYHDLPHRDVYDKLEANLYGAPFGESVIGSVKTVSGLSRDFVMDYFRRHYNPANYIVSVVGPVDLDEIAAFLEENFKDSKEKIVPQPIVLKNGNTVEERKGIDQAHYVFAFHAPAMTQKEFFALEVLDAYLANGMSSKLFLKIREERGLAYNVRSSFSTERNYSYYTIYVGTTKEAIPEVQKIILEEFEKAQNISEADVEEAKERLIGLQKISMEDSSHVMNELVFAELINSAEDYYKREERIRSVGVEDVRRIAKIKDFSTAAIVPA